MAKSSQFAFRLTQQQSRLLERRAERLSATSGLEVTRSDALRLLLDFAGKMERLRETRLADYKQWLDRLPPGPQRDRVQAAHDDWLTMSDERLLGLAELQAAASVATGALQRRSRLAGLDRMTEEEIDAEIRTVLAPRRKRS